MVEFPKFVIQSMPDLEPEEQQFVEVLVTYYHPADKTMYAGRRLFFFNPEGRLVRESNNSLRPGAYGRFIERAFESPTDLIPDFGDLDGKLLPVKSSSPICRPSPTLNLSLLDFGQVKPHRWRG